MTEDTAQSNPVSSLGKARTPRSLPGAGRPSSAASHSSLGLEEARALVASPLWPRIRAFLWDFASLCDPARLAAALAPAGGSGDFPRSLADSPRVARAAERALGLSPVFHSFPAEDGSRLLLLSREDYDRLAQFLGVVALAPALRRVALGAEVRALKAAIPGVYPEALAYAAYFGKCTPLFKRFEPADQAATPAAVQSTGHSLLAAALSDLPPELLLRQRLRFPAGSPADAALGGASSPGEPQKEAAQAANLALKLFNPSEYRTLCS